MDIKEKDKKASEVKSYKDIGIYYLNGVIDESSIKSCIEFVLDENIKKNNEQLNIIINSGGGLVMEAFALIDIMNGSKIPINTIGIGCVASAALTIFLYGKHRTLTPNTYILAHQYAAGSWGKYHELLADRKSQDWLNDKHLEIYTKKTKLNKKQVIEKLLNQSDRFITAQEALSYGICDEIKTF